MGCRFFPEIKIPGEEENKTELNEGAGGEAQ